LRGELTKILQVNPPRVAALYQEDEVRKWATNGWNTERILRLTADLLPSDQLENALQWAFPQAYYSVFALTLALYKTTGQTETSHAGGAAQLRGPSGIRPLPGLFVVYGHGC